MGRDLFSLALPDFTSRRDSLSLPTRHFAAFLAADAREADDEALQSFARWLLDAGCVYFCAWGPGCERVHDVFDRECFKVEPVIVTTWHDEETLDDALWFFVYNAYPDEAYSETCGSAVAICAGHPGWAGQIQRRLSDLNAFNRDMLGDD